MSQVFQFLGECTIYQIEDLYKELSVFINSGDELLFDFSKLKKWDVCFLQMLLAFVKQCKHRTIKLVFKSIPKEMVEAASLLSMDIVLMKEHGVK